ncbi:MltA domain-containing protein [Robbsia sp. Bb-Pol-6]|uniref:peptidoglycan lytic exotransglycosylase n=1 Tax=Robbsia betulipollinis TaxID=2981849 RepID=A0ABT3ZNY9_9BURK|nr:MltA domain-containing protein [Robbsia betulipollinis]MCY0388261.1 MltA domain-containing protein [Robbsia betulipollinis]
MSFSKIVWTVLTAVLLASCAGPRSERALTGTTAGGPSTTPNVAQIVATERLTPAAWSAVSGWGDDELIGAMSALRQSCSRLGAQADWRRPCALAAQIDELDGNATRNFFETNFIPYQLANRDGTVQGLVTGYYEPLLHGSRTREAPYLYPLYRWPGGGHRTAALGSRAELERSGTLNGLELVYVDDPIEAFFLQVQGSGRIVLRDGSVMRVGFAGTNNQPYKSIGRWLLDARELTPAQATMQGIKSWARANPQRVAGLLDVNPRFVFFKEMAPNGEGAGTDGPIGALGVPLTPERSIAVDPTAIPLGLPVFLATTRPLSGASMNRLVFAQDTGSAIKGGVRADFFWGLGDEAGDLAGKMKQSGRMWLILPRS